MEAFLETKGKNWLRDKIYGALETEIFIDGQRVSSNTDYIRGGLIFSTSVDQRFKFKANKPQFCNKVASLKIRTSLSISRFWSASTMFTGDFSTTQQNFQIISLGPYSEGNKNSPSGLFFLIPLFFIAN